MDDDGRRRHLDALFADQPFLSPTMRARGMHDKLREMRSKEIGSYSDSIDRTPELSNAPDWLLPVVGRQVALLQRVECVPGNTERVSFAEATARFRGPAARHRQVSSASDPILRFRDDVLSRWVQEVRPRESDRRGAQRDPDFDLPYEMGPTRKKANGSIDQ